jgi:hypothetical protein
MMPRPDSNVVKALAASTTHGTMMRYQYRAPKSGPPLNQYALCSPTTSR